MNTYYSNLLNVKVTPNELIFDFSSFFPDRPNIAPPSDLKPEVRIVMNAMVLDSLANYFSTAVKQRNAAGGQSKPTTGFTPGASSGS